MAFAWAFSLAGEPRQGTTPGDSASLPIAYVNSAASSPITVTATASSGLPVTFTGSGVCTIAPAGVNEVTISSTDTGSCTVTAHQIGNNEFAPAMDVAHTFNIISFLELFLPTLMR